MGFLTVFRNVLGRDAAITAEEEGVRTEQLVDFTCPLCHRLMGTVDFGREDYFQQESDIFFSGLGQWNKANHEPTCPLLWGGERSLSPITSAHKDA